MKSFRSIKKSCSNGCEYCRKSACPVIINHHIKVKERKNRTHKRISPILSILVQILLWMFGLALVVVSIFIIIRPITFGSKVAEIDYNTRVIAALITVVIGSSFMQISMRLRLKRRISRFKDKLDKRYKY